MLALLGWLGCMATSLAAQDAPHFTIGEYRVLGNTVLTARDIETLLYPQLGDDKSIADVETARKALEQLYKERGYGAIYVDIPEQSVDDGIVRLKVTEGHLDRIRVSGARFYLNGRIRDELPALTPGTVLKLPELQAQIAAVNQDSPDRQVTPVLRAGSDVGKVDVELKVKDDLPLHASAELNNRYTANTTHTRLALNVSYDNLFQRYQSLSLQYQTSPEKTSEVQVLAATYLAPLIGTGRILAFYVVDTNSSFAAAGAAGDYGVLGKGRIYGARFVAKLASDSTTTRSFTLGADYKDFSDDIVLSTATDRTPIQYLGWTAGYAESHRGEHSTGSFNVSANFGLSGLINDPEEFLTKRYLARATYLYVRADGQYERPLFGGTVYGHVAGQWTAQPLISNEGFAIGGAESVRGYLESAQLGDVGASATLELRSASMHRWFGSWAQRFVGYLFTDGGVVSNYRPLPTEVRRHELLSSGAGLRFNGMGKLLATLDWGYPFLDSSYTSAGDSRVDFQFRYDL